MRWDTYGNDSHILAAAAPSHAIGAVLVPSPKQNHILEALPVIGDKIDRRALAARLAS